MSEPLTDSLKACGDAVTGCRPATESKRRALWQRIGDPWTWGAYEARVRNGPCFICAFVTGEPGHVTVYEDDQHTAFLDRYPTVHGKVLVAPKAHIEHVVRELEEPAYLALMSVVRRVALAVEAIVEPKRTYLLSLSSQQGNAHLHWHIAGLPPQERRTGNSSSTPSRPRTACCPTRTGKQRPWSHAYVPPSARGESLSVVCQGRARDGYRRDGLSCEHRRRRLAPSAA